MASILKGQRQEFHKQFLEVRIGGTEMLSTVERRCLRTTTPAPSNTLMADRPRQSGKRNCGNRRSCLQNLQS